MGEIKKLEFKKDWTSRNDFPTVQSDENLARADMQFLFNEIKKYINNDLIPGVTDVSEIEKFSFDAETGALTIEQNGVPKTVTLPKAESSSGPEGAYVVSVIGDYNSGNPRIKVTYSDGGTQTILLGTGFVSAVELVDNTLVVTKNGESKFLTLPSGGSSSNDGSSGSGDSLSAVESVSTFTKVSGEHGSTTAVGGTISSRRYGRNVHIFGEVDFQASRNGSDCPGTVFQVTLPHGKPWTSVICTGQLYTRPSFGSGTQTLKRIPCVVELRPPSTGSSVSVFLELENGYTFTAGESYCVKFGTAYITSQS